MKIFLFCLLGQNIPVGIAVARQRQEARQHKVKSGTYPNLFLKKKMTKQIFVVLLLFCVGDLQGVYDFNDI